MSIRVSVPAGTTSSALRRTAAITPATAGILIQSYAHSDTAHQSPTGGGAYDISSSSSLCVAGPPRTCSISTPILAGNSDVVATTYDAAPVGGTFAGAHVLGQGTVYSILIVANGTNSLRLVVGGTIASVTVTPSTQAPSGSTPGSYPLTFTAFDAQSEAIIAGTNTVTNGPGNTETDTFSNPLVFTVSESGGSGHTLLSLNGGTHAVSVTSLASADVITVYYDGAAAAGYEATITAAAVGASPAAVTMNPLFGPQKIYVANRDNGSVSWWPLAGPYGNVAPAGTVGGPTSGLSDPVALAVDSAGAVYTANDSAAQVVVFNAGLTGDVAATRTFTPTVGVETEGIYVDAAGFEYEASYTTSLIAVMSPGASGTVAPARVIQGALTTLSEPSGMTTDGSGNLYVADFGASSIDVFPPAANGNVAPSRTISGPATLLQKPQAVAIDATGRIIVADEGFSCCSSGFVLIFASGASGNAAPVAQLIGASTGFLDPSGVAIDPGGGFWVSDAFANSLSKFASSANGNVAPLVSIAGPATGLADAQHMAIH
jgi:hypothetical protein